MTVEEEVLGEDFGHLWQVDRQRGAGMEERWGRWTRSCLGGRRKEDESNEESKEDSV